MVENEELSVTQAAERANCGTTTIRRAIRLGHLAAKKIGSYYAIKPEDVDAWKASNWHNPNMRRK